jgi:hypothetical protein
MRLHSLTITRNQSYDRNPDQLKGSVQFEGPSGKQEVTLSPSAILNLLSIIKEECCTSSTKISKDIPGAFRDVKGELLLIEDPLNVKQIED